ncbi:hypothetical protein ABBQ38_000968 [Trebouxia sp. C0009 RCD-2024]
MLAPRRQSLPQPHAPSSFIPAWAPTGLDSAHHTQPAMSASQQSLHARMGRPGGELEEALDPCGSHDAAFSNPSDPPARRKTDTSAAASMPASRHAMQTDQDSEEQHRSSPRHGSYEAAPAVNITIHGSCSFMSPAKMPLETEVHETCSAVLPSNPTQCNQALLTTEHLNAVKLNPEASLAHLHQPARDSAQAADHSITGDAGASCSGAVSPGEGGVQEAGGRRQPDQAATGSIDTAALQKEVTELRQQARMQILT